MLKIFDTKTINIIAVVDSWSSSSSSTFSHAYFTKKSISILKINFNNRYLNFVLVCINIIQYFCTKKNLPNF